VKILFLGGTGNISAECAAWLAERGREVYVMSRGRSAVPSVYRALTADRKDPASMRQALQKVDFEVVINFLGYELADVQLDFEIFQQRVRQYVFISSATVYTKPPPELPIVETTPLANPWWDYARKKIACEQWLLERWNEQRFPVTIVRPSHTYSKRWVPNPVSSSSYTFAARLEQGRPVFVPDDGENRWTLTAASDFAVGLGGLVGNDRAVGEAFHITSDEVLTWNQIYATIAQAVGQADPQIVPIPTDFICEAAPSLTGNLKGDKSHPGVFDNRKIKAFVAGFTCKKSFAAGAAESVAWLRQHPEDQHLNPEIDQLIENVLSKWKKGRIKK
jgi:nucleoside-diphosphate-sugar epimerase